MKFSVMIPWIQFLVKKLVIHESLIASAWGGDHMLNGCTIAIHAREERYPSNMCKRFSGVIASKRYVTTWGCPISKLPSNLMLAPWLRQISRPVLDTRTKAVQFVYGPDCSHMLFFFFLNKWNAPVLVQTYKSGCYRFANINWIWVIILDPIRSKTRSICTQSWSIHMQKLWFNF